MGAAEAKEADPPVAAASGEPDVQRAVQHVMIAFGGDDFGQPRAGGLALSTHRLTFAMYPAVRVALWVLVLLTIVEEPMWVFNSADPDFVKASPDLYPTAGLPMLTRVVTLPIEWALLLFLCAFVGLRVHSVGWRPYVRNFRSAAFAALLAVAMVDALCATLPLLFGVRLYRISAYLRLLMLLLNLPSVMHQLALVRGTIPQLTGASIAFAVLLLVAGFFALLLFTGAQREEIFPNYTDAVYQLLILLTTSNYPDVMMPAYSKNRLSFLFFFFFLIGGYFFLTNLFLAVVCKGHGEQVEADKKAAEESEKMHLQQAFQLLDAKGTGSVGHKTVKMVFAELNRSKITNISAEREALLLETLDADMSESVDEEEFSSLCVLLRIKFRRVEKQTWLLSTFPSLAEAGWFQTLQGLVEGKPPYLDWAIDLLLVLNAVVIAVEATNEAQRVLTHYQGKDDLIHARHGASSEGLHLHRALQQQGLHNGSLGLMPSNSTTHVLALLGQDQQPAAEVLYPSPPPPPFPLPALAPGETRVDPEEMSAFHGLDLAFTTVFFLEMVIKILVLGLPRYVSSMKNCFDGAVSTLSVVTLLLIAYPYFVVDRVFLRRIMALRVLRLLRLLAVIPTLPPIVSTFVRMLPSAGELLLTLAATMYFFSVLGMQLFGGLINKDPARPEFALLMEDDFGQSNYWVNNFNDIPSGMVVCFELIMVNNWMVFSDGFALVTSKWARWFFVAFYIVGVLIMLNIVVAFVLDAFMAQYEDAQRAEEERRRAGVDDDDDKFTIGFKKASKAAGSATKAASEFKIDLDLVPEEQRAAIRQRLTRAGSSNKPAAAGATSPRKDHTTIAE
jgi:hypothetical protein